MPKVSSEISRWFDYPDDPYKGRVRVRLPKGGELQAIRERTTEGRAQHVKEFRQREVVIRQNGYREEVAVTATLEWENFLDENDKPLKCTPGNIRRMCMEDGYYDFIDECLAELEQEAKEKAEAESKN